MFIHFKTLAVLASAAAVPSEGVLSPFPVLGSSFPGFLRWHRLSFRFSTNLSRAWEKLR